MKTLIGIKIKHWNNLLKKYPCITKDCAFANLQGYINCARDYRCISFKEYTKYIRYINKKYIRGWNYVFYR